MVPKPAVAKKAAVPKAAVAKSVAAPKAAAPAKPVKAKKVVVVKKVWPKRKIAPTKPKLVRKLNAVKSVQKQLKCIKRNGGTIRFAKALKTIRHTKKLRLLHQRKKDARALDTTKRRATVSAVAGKKDKDGKRVKPILKEQHRYKICKMRKVYHTQLPLRKLAAKNNFKDMHPETRRHRAWLRPSLTPGTVCILLSGRYQCKKVVFLKQLRRTGLCLVTGPWCVNRVPLRRMDQRFLIATSVRIELPKKFKVPVHIDDAFFKKRKVMKKRVTKPDEDIFKTKKVTLKHKPDRSRKIVQTYIDKNIMRGVKKHKEAASIKKYLKRDFGLMGKRYAHTLNF